MRVAMVSPYSLSRPGGVQGQVQGLARALRTLGHDVAVLAPDDRHRSGLLGPDPSGAVAYSIGRSSAVRSNGSVAPVSLSPLSPVRVRRFARRYGADVVHLHEPLAPLAGYGCLLSRPVPVVGTYHRSGDSRGYYVLGPLARWANGRLAARCAVSDAARDTVRSVLGGTYEVLFNGVEVDRFATADPWPTHGPTVLFLGRHERRKGLGVLLDAFAGLSAPEKQAGPGGQAGEPVLWVAGDGPETEALQRRHPPSARLDWLGVLDDASVASRLAGADVLCAPSLDGESFGMVLLEGMAAGCAVVASDIPGYRAAAGGHARLVPPDDVAALREALATALAAGSGGADGPGGDGDGGAARRAALAHAERWSMGRLAAQYLEVYSRVVAAGTGTPGTGERAG